jgi:hypothetical protein
MGSGGIDPHFLDLGIRWSRVIILTPRPLYPRWSPEPRYVLDRRLHDHRTGLNDVDKIELLHLPGLECRPVGCPVTILTTNVKWILKSKVELLWTVFISLRIGQRRSFVNTIMSIRVSWKAGDFIVSSQGLCCVELFNPWSTHSGSPNGWSNRDNLLKWMHQRGATFQLEMPGKILVHLDPQNLCSEHIRVTVHWV